MERLLSAYPLLIKDPFYSIWLKGERLNRDEIVNWMGVPKKMLGIVEIDGKKYRYMGNDSCYEEIEQVDLKVGVFDTTFVFENEAIKLSVSFLSPLLLNDLEILSNPSCYVIYHATTKKVIKEVSIQLYLNENLTYQTKGSIRGDVLHFLNYELAYFGRDKQNVLSHSADLNNADWGYYYLLADHCDLLSINDEIYLMGVNQHMNSKQIEGKFIVSFDDVCSIFYYGEFLRGYYFSSPKVTIFDAMEDAYCNFSNVIKKCDDFEQDLYARSKPYGEDYKTIVQAAYRQTIAAHKLVKDEKGRTLFLSKENGSDGCIATVDVTYPSMPLFLLYNPSLIFSMLYPIVDFASMPVWEFDFAPHDAGVYPYCLGQYYAIYNKEGKYQHQINYLKADYGVLPRYYQYPKGQNLYEFHKQMPVEECGNMLILTYLASRDTKDYQFIVQYYDLLKKWADYLLSCPLYPEHQLCTDDFAGPSKYNLNLAIKSTVAIATFGKINDLLKKDSKKYFDEAKNRAKELECNAIKGYLPLQKDAINTYSLKYNLYCDIVCKTNLFSNDLKEKEFNQYLQECSTFGCPLDSRAQYSKTDWQIWVCCFTQDVKKQKIIYKKIADYIKKTPNRVAFSDWYDTKTAQACHYGEDHRMFLNRSVQGGCFANLYYDSISKEENE